MLSPKSELRFFTAQFYLKNFLSIPSFIQELLPKKISGI